MDNVEPKLMPHALLKEITDGFSDDRILGTGTFGVVYKGKDGDGKKIAVKILKFTGGVADNDFEREFNNLAMLKHPNIIRLLGFCNEKEREYAEYNGEHIIAFRLHRALCFEYMQNGSLRSHLSDVDHGFGWHKRYRIIKGVCEGLKYLHMGKPPVFHLDLKPDNILLDKNMVPKIADFGLSRLLGDESTKMTKSPVGTCGYLPPEYINLQIISKEFDIFSLGVIIIKIIVGPDSYFRIGELKKTEFTEHIINKWRERLQLIPGYAPLVEAECQQLKKCIEIGLQCLETDKTKRPTIGYIIDQLNETEKHKTSPASWVEMFDDRKPITPKSNMPEMDSEASGGKRSESKPCIGSTSILEQPLDFWKKITNDFSDERKISSSPFGTFYKGVLDDGQLIAVQKQSNPPVVRQKVFIKAATNLMALHHNNIVKLLSYCMETDKKMFEHNGGILVSDVVERVFCFEYLSHGSLHDYLLDDTNRTDWFTKFKIIKGICQGLRFLHHGNMWNPIVHLDLHRDSIMFDDNMVPKISSFDLFRVSSPEMSRINTKNVCGKIGYMAPEYLYRGEISPRADIYSLGVLIMEVTTGEMNCSSNKDMSARDFIDMIRDTWTDGHIASMYSSLNAVGLQQVRACIEIGLKCVDVDQNRRPSIVEIVDLIDNEMSKQSVANNVGTGVCAELLDVHPAQLRLPFKPDKLISCSLRLTNTRDDHVAVRLSTESARKYMSKMPLCCVVPPMTTYTLVVTRSQQRKQPLSGSSNEFLTLESSIVADGDTVLKNAYLDSAVKEFRNFFKEAKEAAADKVYELKLNVISDPLQEISSVQQSEIEIMKFSQVLSVDVHLTKPWILTATHGGEVVIWDFHAQAPVNSFDFTHQPVYSAKFIEREEWLVAGDGYGTIYVYNYDTGEEITSIDEAHDGDITALAVHPTDPYVLSSSDDHLIKLWDWKNDWECARTFEGHMNKVTHVNFNPMDANSFVSSCLDHTIKIWNIFPSESKTTLSGSSGLLCVHNYRSNMRQYLVSGSLDGTAQVWDMDTGRCIQTLQGHVSHISCVYRHPKLPLVITGSNDGTLRLWNSNTYRLEKIIGINLGAVYSLGYINDLRRIVVGCHQGIAIMETKFP